MANLLSISKTPDKESHSSIDSHTVLWAILLRELVSKLIKSVLNVKTEKRMVIRLSTN
jgi:hypothetical protein